MNHIHIEQHRALTFAIVRAQRVQHVYGGAAQQLLPQRVAAPQFQIQTALRRHIAAGYKETYCLCTLHVIFFLIFEHAEVLNFLPSPIKRNDNRKVRETTELHKEFSTSMTVCWHACLRALTG